MANAEFEQLRILAQEIRQGIVRPLGETGFHTTDLYKALLQKNGFLTDRERDLIDRTNAQVGRSELDWAKSLENYAAHLLRQKGQIVTAAALQQEKKSLFIPSYEATISWFNWYESLEPFLHQNQASQEIAKIKGWIIAADKISRGLTITEHYSDRTATQIATPSFSGGPNNQPLQVFMLHSSRPGIHTDGEIRASYTELWYILVEHFLLSPPHETDVKKAIEGFLAKQQAPKAA